MLSVDAGLRSLFDSGVYNWISPTISPMVEALQIRRKGHRDMIDNLLYATASDRGIVFLTLDREDGLLIRCLKLAYLCSTAIEI